MLEILRKNASSWITKVLLLLIIVVFIFFFGWTKGSKNGSDQGGVVAEVNGEKINQEELARLVQNQMEAYQQMYQDKLPDELVSQFQKMSLQSLIEDRIVRSEAEKMGLRVSDEEISRDIKNNPNLKVKGIFDAEQYKNVFRPWFLNHNGIDYEEYLRREQLKDKFRALFSKGIVVSDNEVKNHYTFDNTKLALQIVAIRSETLAKEPKDSKSAETLAAGLWPSFVKGQVSPLLKKYNLKSRDIPLTPLSQSTTFFPGEDDTDAAFKTIMSLTREKPYPSSPIQIGSSYYLVKLTARADPDLNEFEKNKIAERTKVEKEFAERFYELWYQRALTKAKIKIHES